MKRKIRKLLSNYIDAERKLIRELDELDSGGQDCSCEIRSEVIRIVCEDGEFPEIIERCLGCGGEKDE